MVGLFYLEGDAHASTCLAINHTERILDFPVCRLLPLIPCLLLLPVLVAAAGGRAHSWKPAHELGSQQLTLDGVHYLVVPSNLDQNLSAAIEDFQNLYEDIYGRELRLLDEGQPKQAIEFRRSATVGEGGAFRIVRNRTRITIYGTDAHSWANAIYAICSEMMGARWYWAGELGFESVAPSRLHFSNRPWIARPAFTQRRLYPVENAYGRRNRLNNLYSFNHNLASIFNSQAFENSPEAFAEINGRRKAPTGSRATDPQPDFTDPLTVEMAAKAALDYFEANPERTTFSLSINDNVLFDTSEDTQAVVAPLRYFRGRPNYTDLVFGFMNQVAERVFDDAGAWVTPSGDKRYLTGLAYYWTEPAPSIRIHPRVMPVLTADRAQWHDAAFRAEDQELIAAWARSGSERIATWDYYFGAPYLYPRQMNQWIDQSIQYLSEQGVDVFFSQLPTFWGLDGAKPWLASTLLWNPDQNADELLDEYYSSFFGEAANAMRAFYETAEAHRNANEGTADWIKLYKDESGIALFTEDVLRDMRGLLTEAEQAVQQDARRFARVRVVSDAFGLTESYAAYDRSRQALVWMAFRSPEQTDAVTDQLAEFRQARRDFREYLDRFLEESYLPPARRHLELSQSNPTAMARAVIEGPAGPDFVSLVADPGLHHLGREQRNFLGPELPKLEDWYMDYRPSENFMVGPSQHGVGDSGLRITDADVVSVFNTFPVVSNRNYALRLKADWKIGLDNRVHVHVAWLDRGGRRLNGRIPLRFPIGESGVPLDIFLPLTAPNNAYDVRIRIMVSRQYPGDFLDLSYLDFGTVN